MDSLIVSSKEYRIYNYRYAVARDGQVLIVNTRTVAKTCPRKDGYIAIGKDLVHRMVATCWVHKADSLADDVHHRNEVRSDNRADNLEWLTHKEHIARHPLHGHQPATEESKQKIREYRTGRKSSEQTKLKQRIANLKLGIRPPARPKGFKVPEDQCAQQSELHWRNTTCEINGVVFRSFAEAGRALGMNSLTIRKRCLAATFPDYRLGRD